MAIKMGVNNKKNSICQECGRKYANTKEMYNLMICDTKFVLCFDCIDNIFHKTLKSNCMYNAKLKTKEDQQRINRDYDIKHPVAKDFMNPPISKKKPKCFGEFLEEEKCKVCPYKNKCEIEFEKQWEE